MADLAERNHYISFHCFECINEEVILSNIRANGLFVLDSRDFHIKKLEPFIHVPYGIERIHSCSCAWGQTVYFSPDCNGSGIHKYNAATGEQSRIETGSFTCGGAFPLDDGIVFLPTYKADGIWKLDIETDRLSPVRWRGFREGEAPYYIESGQASDGKIWMTPVGGPYLFIIDPAAWETRRMVIGDSGCQLLQCAQEGTFFWFTRLNDERIIRWNMESGDVRYYTLYQPGSKERFAYRDMWFLYKRIIACEGRAFIVDGSGIYSIDAESGDSELLALLPKENLKAAISNWYVEHCICGRKAVVCFCPTNLVAVINLDTLNVTFYDTTVRDAPEFEEYVRMVCDQKMEEALKNKVTMEGSEPDLNDLEGLIALVQYCGKEEAAAEKSAGIGEVIYRNV